MPRLTNTNYLRYRTRLKDDWFGHDRWTFGRLPLGEQWALHDFFAPTEDLTDEAALVFRRNISRLRPALPQMAGRAYRHALEFLGAAPVARAPAGPNRYQRRHSRGEMKVTVRAVSQTKPDLERLARLVVAMAKEDLRREEAEAEFKPEESPEEESKAA